MELCSPSWARRPSSSSTLLMLRWQLSARSRSIPTAPCTQLCSSWVVSRMGTCQSPWSAHTPSTSRGPWLLSQQLGTPGECCRLLGANCGILGAELNPKRSHGEGRRPRPAPRAGPAPHSPPWPASPVGTLTVLLAGTEASRPISASSVSLSTTRASVSMASSSLPSTGSQAEVSKCSSQRLLQAGARAHARAAMTGSR